MNQLEIVPESTIGSLVAQRPGLARFLEANNIDYCCGGGKTIAEVSRTRGWQSDHLIANLHEAAAQVEDQTASSALDMSLTELADHIETTHHRYLRSELPRLKEIIEKVTNAHGDRDPRLATIRSIFSDFARELSMHMMKEEQVLFPIIRQMDASATALEFHCGSVANPIRQMEREHYNAGAALEQFRTLTDGYTPPESACNTYRVMLAALSDLQSDMYQHVHKEDSILFPRAIERERELESVLAADK